VPRFRGHWYSFQVGSALFVSLDADDVVYQDAGPLVSGPAALTPRTRTTRPLKRSRSAAPAQTATGIAGRPRPPGPPVTLGKPTLPTAGPGVPGWPPPSDRVGPGKQAYRWVQTSAQS